jgi:hypothetical protein
MRSYYLAIGSMFFVLAACEGDSFTDGSGDTTSATTTSTSGTSGQGGSGGGSTTTTSAGGSGQGGSTSSSGKGGDGGSTMQFCGGIGGVDCGPKFFCDYPNDNCGDGDTGGLCKPRPDSCGDVYDPVCGCDHITYGNDCEAHAAGVDVGSTGVCPN